MIGTKRDIQDTRCLFLNEAAARAKNKSRKWLGREVGQEWDVKYHRIRSKTKLRNLWTIVLNDSADLGDCSRLIICSVTWEIILSLDT